MQRPQDIDLIDVSPKQLVSVAAALIPFLENAFKHGTSEQLEKPWLSVDLAVENSTLRCKIVNSKNEGHGINLNGIGVNNVQKMLAILYPRDHELKMNNEDDFYAVALTVKLKNHRNPGALAPEITKENYLV